MADERQRRIDRLLLVGEVEEFLYREARLLDERRFREWLELFTADIRYWMAQRTTRYPKGSKAILVSDAAGYDDDDLPHEGGLALYDENLDTLERRVARLETGLAWSEDPPSRTRRLITNVEIEPRTGLQFGPMANESEIKVHANFLVYKNRAETEEDFFVGTRKDVLRRVGDEWKIASRRIILDQTVIMAKNISIFF